MSEEEPDFVVTMDGKQYRLCTSTVRLQGGRQQKICYFVQIGENDSRPDELPGLSGYTVCENPRSQRLSPQLIGRALAALATAASFTQEQIEEYLELLAESMDAIDQYKFFHQFYTAFQKD